MYNLLPETDDGRPWLFVTYTDHETPAKGPGSCRPSAWGTLPGGRATLALALHPSV